MSKSNMVILRGVNLTRDAESQAVGQSAVVKFGVAVNNVCYDKATQQYVKQDAYFFDVEAWNVKQELYQHLTKGARVVIVGELVQQQWTAKDGTKRSSVKIKADTIDMIQRTEPAAQYAPEPTPDPYQQQAYQTPPLPVYGEVRQLPPQQAQDYIPFDNPGRDPQRYTPSGIRTSD